MYHPAFRNKDRDKKEKMAPRNPSSSTASTTIHEDQEFESAQETYLSSIRESQVAYTSYGKPVAEGSRLSKVSQQYDVDGNGELDQVEQRMRDLDKTGKGHLSNDTVYDLVLQQMQTQQALMRTKRIAMFLLLLVVLLGFSNFGTSFAAAHLSKETTTNGNDELVHKSTNKALSTQSTTEVIVIARTTNDAQTGERRLCISQEIQSPEGENDSSALFGQDDCEPDSSYISMSKSDCDHMKRKCRQGNTVNLQRSWISSSVTTSYKVCPFVVGTINDYDTSQLTNDNGDHFYVEEDTNGNCKLYGDAVTQGEGLICMVDGDCDDGLGCSKIQEKVGSCQSRCREKGWSQERVVACESSCDVPSCERMSSDEL